VDPLHELEALVVAVQGSGKYRTVSPDLIRNIGARELAAHGNLREAIKASKSKLHQVGAAYLPARLQYERWERALTEVRGDPVALRDVCRQVLAQHASTRERLPILDSIFQRTLAELAPLSSVLDVASGLNPLAAPWMPLAPGARYDACDIYSDMVGFVGNCLPIMGLAGAATVRDVTLGLPEMSGVDVVLLLKAVPCLEQIDKGCVPRILASLPSRHVVVSYPARSLGGADRRMVDNYAAHMRALLQGRNWLCQRFDYPSELVFLLERPAATKEATGPTLSQGVL